MSLKDADTLELLDRFNYLVGKYVPLAVELAPKLEEFGKYRKELQLIVGELAIRGIKPKEPEELKKVIESAIEQRSKKTENVTQPDTSTGRGESRTNLPETSK